MLRPGFEACGSPGEVANDAGLGHRYGMFVTKDDKGQQTLVHQYQPVNAKKMVWTTIALTATDQLRQRMAWALSQIYVVSEEGLNKGAESEVWHVYYDVFVRHAFGNLRDVLKEVSYSPLMAEYLTFRQVQLWPCIVTACIVMDLYSYGRYSYGRVPDVPTGIVMALYSYGLYSYGLYSYGQYSYGRVPDVPTGIVMALYSYGLYNYGRVLDVPTGRP